MQLGCDEAQGYYYGRPMPWDEFIRNYLELPYRAVGNLTT